VFFFCCFFYVLTYFARTLVEGHMKDKDLPIDRRLRGYSTGTGCYSLVNALMQKHTHTHTHTKGAGAYTMKPV